MNLYEQMNANLMRNDDAKVVTTVTNEKKRSLDNDSGILSVTTSRLQPGIDHDAEVDAGGYMRDITKEGAVTKPAIELDYAVLIHLADSGKTDSDIGPLDAALFLFALNLVRNCPESGFMAMGHQYVPFWRKRLAPEAWAIVTAEIKTRLQCVDRAAEGKAA